MAAELNLPFSESTIAAANVWYATGVSWIDKESVNLGLTYLDKAVAVFQENGDVRMATLARHQKLLGLCLEGREEDVESQFAEVMQGYTWLGDHYGRMLLLSHLAQSLSSQTRWRRAMGYFNLAVQLARRHRYARVEAYILSQQAAVYRSRENDLAAVAGYQRASEIVGEGGDRIRYRYALAEALARMGESNEATVILEDLQSRLIAQHSFRLALEPLKLLGELYDEAEMRDERNRISELMHLCGQQMIQRPDERRPSAYHGPPIDGERWIDERVSTEHSLAHDALAEADAPAPPEVEVME